MIMAALAAAAATVSIPFAPSEAPLRYEVRQEHRSATTSVAFSAIRTVRFVREAGGWRLESTVDSYATSAIGLAKTIFEAGMSSLKGIKTAYSIGPTGRMLGVVDADLVWTRMVAGYHRVLSAAEADPRLPPARKAGVRSIVAAMEALPESARFERMLDDVRPLTDHAGIVATVGQAKTFEAPAAKGHETLVSIEARHARFALESDASGGPLQALKVAERSATEIAIDTGLLVGSTRTRITTDAAGVQQTVVETRTLSPPGK